jgi:hypothetical protein
MLRHTGNSAASDGGVVVEHLAEDILVEGNTFAGSTTGVSVDSTCKRVLNRGNVVTAPEYHP